MEKLYEIIVNERHRDCQRMWYIFSVMSIMNSSLLAALIFVESKEISSTTLITFLGFFICSIWFLLIDKMIAWSNWWEKKLEEIEPSYFEWVEKNSEMKLPKNFKVFVERQGIVTKGISTRFIARYLPFIFLLCWVFFLNRDSFFPKYITTIVDILLLTFIIVTLLFIVKKST